MKPLLTINNLHASVEGKEVLHGVDLTINPGELHVLMGPNGSGKSSLALTLFGHPDYVVTKGSAAVNGKPILKLKTHERACLGMFLSFQHPVGIPGVSVANLVRTASKHLSGGERIDVKTFRSRLNGLLDDLHLPKTFLDRSVNDGFSGGEKKLSEILQLGATAPKLCILDEPDSGLDIDSLKRIAGIINALRTPERGFLLITHYQRLLAHLEPTAVHVFLNGRIVRSGDRTVAEELEQIGYEGVTASSQ